MNQHYKEFQRPTPLEAPVPSAVTPGKQYVHAKTGGLYEVVALALIEATLFEVVVYRSVSTGQHWVRPTTEFLDGRFVVPPTDQLSFPLED